MLKGELLSESSIDNASSIFAFLVLSVVLIGEFTIFINKERSSWKHEIKIPQI